MIAVYVLAVWLACGSFHLFLLGARTPKALRSQPYDKADYEAAQKVGFILGPLSIPAWAFYFLYSVCRYAGHLGEKWADRER